MAQLRYRLEAADLDWSDFAIGDRTGFSARAILDELPTRTLVEGFQAEVVEPFIAGGDEEYVAVALFTDWGELGAIEGLREGQEAVYAVADRPATSMEHGTTLRGGDQPANEPGADERSAPACGQHQPSSSVKDEATIPRPPLEQASGLPPSAPAPRTGLCP